MILALIGAQALNPAKGRPPVNVVELIDPNAREVSFQVLASLPRLNKRQYDALDALVDLIPRDLEGYSRRDIVDVTNGDTVRCVVGPDYVRIAFNFPLANWTSGFSLMDALVHGSRLTAPEIPHFSKPSAWMWALRPYEKSRTATPAEIRELYQTLFRPENITLAVGGPVTPGKAAKDWGAKVAAWTFPRVRRTFADDAPLVPLAKSPAGISSIELSGPPFPANDPRLPLKTLTLIALGSGKGSSLFKVERQKLGFSYRQEALLYPIAEGWQPRFISLMKPASDLPEKAEALRAALLEDIKGWTESDLQRALGMADAVFNRGVDFSPFCFGPNGSLDASLESQAFQVAYWQIKTGTPWDPIAFVQSMRSSTLEDLKTTAEGMLTVAMKRVIK